MSRPLDETTPHTSLDNALHLLERVAHLTVRDGVVTGVSQAVSRELGFGAEQLLGLKLTELGDRIGAANDDDKADLGGSEPLDLLLGPEFDEQRIRLMPLGKVGETSYFEVRTATEYQVGNDVMTGLPDRSAMLGHLGRCLRVAADGSETAVLFCDVDNFKLVNDRFGRPAGDEFLTELAARLRLAVRGIDLVGRNGGDQFLVVVRGLGNADEARGFAARVLEQVTGQMLVAGVKFPVSLSIGVTLSAGDSRGAADLIGKAELAMRKAKRLGRNRIQFYNSVLEDEAAARSRNLGMLESAVRNDQLLVHFQHVVPAGGSSSQPIGVEALGRWQHPTDGLVLPDRFIGLAEETGYITTLGTHLIELAIRGFVNWPGQSPGFLAVNMSPLQLSTDGAANLVLEALDRHHLDPDLLVVELTEEAFARGLPVLNNLRTFREAGVRIFLDDFGTGYSSLSYLRRFPIDGIKIDQSFLHPTLDRGLVRIIVEIAGAMGLVTVAEGIETAESFQQLADLEVTYAQGYLIDRPGPAGPLTGWLAAAQ